jgi:hypothetical protein
VPGLFLTGSGTHPVAGISGMPGQNAAKTMIKQLKRAAKHPKAYAAESDRAWESAPPVPETEATDTSSRQNSVPNGVPNPADMTPPRPG